MATAEAPKDLDPAYVAESNLPRILGVSSVLFFLAAIFVALRMYVRLRIVRSVGRDDWTMAACLVFTCSGWIIFVIQSFHGLGRHFDTISPEDKIKFAHVGFWQSILSAATAMGLLKISIALNLLRLSHSRWYSWPLWGSIGTVFTYNSLPEPSQSNDDAAFVSAYSLWGWLGFLLHCFPMAKHWDASIPGTCYSIKVFVNTALVNTAFNIFTDVFYAAMPVPIIWKLQMKRKTRLYLIAILSLGYFAVIMGILKAVAQINFSKDHDRTFNQWVQFWGFLQLCVGIVAASSPSLKPIVSRALKLSDYSHSRGGFNSSRTGNTGGLRTIGGGGTGGSNIRSKHQDAFELRDLGDSEEAIQQQDKAFDRVGGKGHSSAAATFYKAGGSEGERSGSEEMILGPGQSPPNNSFKGIMMTREVIVK
ncbi:Fc.00g025610.m01.CDS01 [Cosmosporella sp. VM-42]